MWVSCWPKGSHENLQTTQCCQGCSPEGDSNALLLQTTPTQLTEHGEVAGPTQNLHPYGLAFGIVRYSAHLPKKKHKPTQLETLWSTLVSCMLWPCGYQYARAMVAQSLWEEPNNHSCRRRLRDQEPGWGTLLPSLLCRNEQQWFHSVTTVVLL